MCACGVILLLVSYHSALVIMRVVLFLWRTVTCEGMHVARGYEARLPDRLACVLRYAGCVQVVREVFPIIKDHQRLFTIIKVFYNHFKVRGRRWLVVACMSSADCLLFVFGSRPSPLCMHRV